jgi:3-oxoacyl-[acyl-carrier-protein] synthase-1
MPRVVITGLGIVSSIGNGIDEVTRSLRESRSGMVYMPEMKELGYRCCVYAPVRDLDTSGIRRKTLRTLSSAALFAAVAARQALDDAGLSPEELGGGRAGVVVGTGAGGISETPRAEDTVAAGAATSRLGALGVVKMMNSTASGSLAASLGVNGRVCSLSAACATGLFNIGHAYELIKLGLQDVCLCGSAEEDTWKQVGLSADNSAGMPTDWNDRPTEACRPYDVDRQGLVMSAGAGVLVIESLERAEERGARIYAEITGYGCANEGADMFIPMGDGLRRAINEAMRESADQGVDRLDYINAHGTGTRSGDQVEARVLHDLFGHEPLVSSTKSISGHSQGATASQETVYTVLMLHHEFVAPTVNLERVDPECSGIRHAVTLCDQRLRTAMTCNTGLGGSNASLVLRKLP